MKVTDKTCQECSGCTACMNICPVNAIEMKENKEGFLYPSIDEKKCIDCGLCYKICPFDEKWVSKNQNKEPDVYAIKNKNEEVRKSSTSGGIFTVLAEYVLHKSGIVYGAAFDENMVVNHIRVTTNEELSKLRGSKYVQSNLKDIFKEVKKDLDDQKYVIFSGTPCQVAGLSAFLNKEYERLIKIDLVCHGVPSPKLFRDHIKNIENNSSNKVKEYYFRDKTNGWHKHTEKVVFENGNNDYRSDISQAFKYLYAEHSMLRESCNNCKLCSVKRISDITMGDYWGIEKKYKKFDDNKGVSLLLVNTEKGKKIFEEVKDKINYKKTCKEECLQHNLIKPTKVSPNRKKFWDDYFKYGYKYITKKYSCCGVKLKILIKIKNMSPQKLKNIIKKILKR